MQRVVAYRVEYPPYKVEYDEDRHKVTGFKGNNDGKGISISFEMPEHSEHFASERKGSQLEGLRLVTFELKDDLWDAIQWRASNTVKKADVKVSWQDQVEGLKAPTWSDGASLTKAVKQRALSFSTAWLDVLDGGIKNTRASVHYFEDNEDGLEDKDEVYAYLEGEEADGAKVDKDQVEGQGYDTFITVGKAKRLGYLR